MSIAAKTWSVNEIVTAANMNTYVRDNDADLDTRLKASAFIETGSYTGDGTTDKTVTLTDTELDIKFLRIWHSSSDGGTITSNWTSDNFVTVVGTGWDIRETAGAMVTNDDQIISVGTGNFHVDDASGNNHPNADGTTYYYMAIGTH
jgi:hypothetical protein